MSHDLLPLFDKINEIPWERFDPAYGDMKVAKTMLRELIVGDEDERLDAINDLLWDTACHQGTLTALTPWILEVVLELLKFKDLMDDPLNVEVRLLQEAMCFVRTCVDNGYLMERDDKESTRIHINKLVLLGRGVFELYTHHKNPHVVRDVLWLLTYCKRFAAEDEHALASCEE